MRFHTASGVPTTIWIAENVAEREDCCEFIETNGGTVTADTASADILLVDANSRQGREVARIWEGSKVVLKSIWLDVCRQEDKFLNAADNWGGWQVLSSEPSATPDRPSAPPKPSVPSPQSSHSLFPFSMPQLPLTPSTNPNPLMLNSSSTYLPNCNFVHPQAFSSSPAFQIPMNPMPFAVPMPIPMPPQMDPTTAAAFINANPQAQQYFQALYAAVVAGNPTPTSQQPVVATPLTSSHSVSSTSDSTSEPAIGDPQKEVDIPHCTPESPVSPKPSSASFRAQRARGQEAAKIFTRNGQRLSFFVHRDVGNRTQTLKAIESNGGTVIAYINQADLVVLPVAETKVAQCGEHILQAMQQNVPIIKKQWIEDCIEDNTRYEPDEYFHRVPGAKPLSGGFWTRGCARKASLDAPQKPNTSKVHIAEKPICDDEDEDEDENELDVQDKETQEVFGDEEADSSEETADCTTRQRSKRILMSSKVATSSIAGRDGLALPPLHSASPIRHGSTRHKFTDAEIEWAEDYCRISWTLDPSRTVGSIAEELAGEKPHRHSAKSWANRMGQKQPGPQRDRFKEIQRLARKENALRQQGERGIDPSSVDKSIEHMPPKLDSTSSHVQRQVVKRPASTMHTIPDTHNLPVWAEDVFFPDPPGTEQRVQHTRNPGQFFYTDAELKYAYDLCRACWIVDPDIDANTILQHIADVLPHHSLSGWKTKFRPSEDHTLTTIAREARVEHNRRVASASSNTFSSIVPAVKKPRLPISALRPSPGGCAGTEESTSIASTSVQVARTNDTANLPLPPWAVDLKWPKPPPESQAKSVGTQKVMYRFTEAENRYAEAWCRIQWIIDPSTSQQHLAAGLESKIPWHSASSWHKAMNRHLSKQLNVVLVNARRERAVMMAL
ncbi:hypothetical protein CYLTODRAFT_426042 [Cylindrobasidium torrendii FP15055 ss-10]|uniref:BRCT domain-containing protein n=1 Tax=Cylindrobasidium torrendii FP15055 ss-10 TaxID=1314674 RepID=A0A0D7B1X3_9AGAR|nr:hypothetical protein CYLTODRAFT_426042 [Cylindrobasidium torrendii FP15055 ss-10]